MAEYQTKYGIYEQNCGLRKCTCRSAMMAVAKVMEPYLRDESL
jgi:hypothetical protein